MDNSSTDRWSAAELRLAGKRLEWGGEHEVDPGTALALELSCPSGVGVNITVLGLRLYLATDLLAANMSSTETSILEVQLEARGSNQRMASQQWQQQFAGERYVGETMVTLTERGRPIEGAECLLVFRLGPADQKRYAYMRTTLEDEDRRALRSSVAGVVGAFGSGHGSACDRLEARWLALSKAHEQLGKALPPIILSPHTVLSFASTAVEWSDHTSQRSLSGAAPLPGTSWQRIPGQGSQGESFLPRRLVLRYARENSDVPANRYVRSTVDQVIDEARSIEQEARARADEVRARCAKPLPGRWRARLERSLADYESLAARASRLRRRSSLGWLAGTFLGRISPAPPRSTDLVWRDNSYYRRIRIIGRNLERELAAAEDAFLPGTTLSPAASINRLYELWFAMLLLRTLCGRMGCRLLKKGGRTALSGGADKANYLLGPGSWAELLAPSGRRLILRFDMEYPAIRTDADFAHPRTRLAYGIDRRLWPQAKGRPDLALEVWDDEADRQVPVIIIFDATWSTRLDNQLSKFLYRESIRDFTRTEASGKPARPVRASWVVYPAPEEDMDYEDDYRTGRLPLEPNDHASDVLRPLLEQLLLRTGAVDAV